MTENHQVEAQYVEQMTHVMIAINNFFNPTGEKNTGVVLLVFPYGETDTGRLNYMSNGADRKDIVCLFKEMIAKFEGQPDVSGNE